MDIAVFKEAQEAYARGDYRVALVGFTACTSDVAELSSAEVGKFFHLIGNCYIKSGEPAKAAEFYSKALELASDERRPALLVNLGTAYLSSEEYDAALEAFSKALSHKSYATPYKALSGIGAVQLKLQNPEAAGSAYREAALDASNPSPGKALVNLGICFMELDRAADAISTYLTALDCGLRPADASKCHANLGQAYLSQGRVGEAVDAFKAATADGTYKLSAIAAHDMAMAMSLLERFGSILGAEETSSQQAGEQDVPAEAADEQPVASAEVEPVQVEAEVRPAAEGDEEPALELGGTQLMESVAAESSVDSADDVPAAAQSEPAVWEPVSFAEDATSAAGEGDVEADGGLASDDEARSASDFAEAATQVFPVVSAPVAGDETAAQGDDPEATAQAAAFDEDLPTDAFKAMDEDDEALIPSPEDTAFFTIKEEDIEAAAKEERRKARKSHTGLKVAVGIVIVLIALAAAAAVAYIRGYGYPLQENLARGFMDAVIAQESTDAYWSDSVNQDSRDAQMAPLSTVNTYELTAVQRSTSSSAVFVKATLNGGGTAYYELMMGRDLIGWNLEYVELYFPSEQ